MKLKRKNSRIRGLACSLFLLMAAVAFTDYLIYDANQSDVYSHIRSLGGQMRSIGGWPFGKEYVVVFDRALTNEEIKQLTPLNDLMPRDYVGIYLHRDQTAEQTKLARMTLKKCKVHEKDD